jgi:hypothetical protein
VSTAVEAAPGGLVLSATSARGGTTGEKSPGHDVPADAALSDLIGSLWQPAFPSPDLVDTAAALLPAIREIRGQFPRDEGPVWRFTVAPGCVAVGTMDYAKRYRRDQNDHDRRVLDTDAVAAWGNERDDDGEFLHELGEAPPEPIPCREVTEWSARSRSRMTRRLCELDYTRLFVGEDGQEHGRLPAMVTLTYPGEWLVVAPNGRAAKAHLRAFRERYRRAWGEDLVCIWKLEFQRRGAVHFHMLCCPPHGVDRVLGLAFREWLSWTWASVVKHPDQEERARHLLAGTGIDYAEGLRNRDPRRLAAYFGKHNAAGDKEYQHVVPEAWQEPGAGPGRFWGHWVLRPKRVTVELRTDEAVAVARVMRRWSRAQRRTRVVTRPRVRGGRRVEPVPQAGDQCGSVVGLAGAQLLEDHATRPVKFRKTTVRAVHVARGRGWLALNDGPAFAADLARYLEIRRGHPAPAFPTPDVPGCASRDGLLNEKTMSSGSGAWRNRVRTDLDEAEMWPPPPPTDRERIRRLVAWQDAWARVREVEDMHPLVP